MFAIPLRWAHACTMRDVAARQPGATFHAAAPEQTRALWVTRTTLTSPEAIRQMVAEAQAGGFNTLLVQVRGRGDAYYSGTIEPRAPELAGKPSFDPLASVLEHAHRAGPEGPRLGRGQSGVELGRRCRHRAIT